MAIGKTGVSSTTVGGLLAQDLRIPHYQRPYSWEPATALQLLDDVHDAFTDPDRRDVPYVLGAVILHAEAGHDWFDVVDGQQRLLTLRLLLTLLEGSKAPWPAPTADNALTRVWSALARRVDALREDDRSPLTTFVRDKCQLIRVVTDDHDEAFRVFDSQNYRGKPLAPHDLLKAHHLREMRNESAAMKVAVVESWESVTDEELHRLFGTYLSRILRWSRGESALSFTAQDIGIFKGISARRRQPPSARYHMAAQAAIPLLAAWDNGPERFPDRDADRARFQLDAPLLAGRPFFEMVAFMLGELKALAREAFPDDLHTYGHYDMARLDASGSLAERPSRNRYRYVSELYLGALLYYTNKFGDEDFERARVDLFAWAYSLRATNLRVLARSVDIRARGAGDVPSAFRLMRDTDSGRPTQRVATSWSPYNDQHEVALVTLLKELAP